MPLAGRVRLKTFLLGVGGLVVVGALGAGALVSTGVIGAGVVVGAAAKNAKERQATQPVVAPVPAASPAPAPAPAPAPSATDVALSYQGKNLLSPKLKDVSQGRPYKINVYQDEGHTSVNRLKIDLDRDDRWDEKWTFDGDGITRQVAPNDDEVYGEPQTWTGSGWSGGDAPEPAPAPAPAAGLSPVEAAAMAYQGRNLGSPKLKDVTKGKPYKINVYQDEGKTTANRLKIDRDRDDRWDEKWTFDGDAVTRKVASQDDEAYDVEQRWTGSGWE
jgi:hypothetical protein